MPGSRSLTVYAGDDYTHTVTAVDGNGDPVDLSDRTWTAQWRRSRVSATAVAFTVDTTNAAAGVLVVSLTAAQTAQLASGEWDLQGVYGDGTVETLLQGEVVVTKDVTRT